MKNIDTETAMHLLERAIAILQQNGEKDWQPGLKIVWQFLEANDFNRARNSYCSMTAGGRGFSEYYIWDEDYSERVKKNKELGEIRQKLAIFFSK